jgi:hypothetical protein
MWNNEIEQIFDLVNKSRSKSLTSGCYIESISDHQQIIKRIGRSLLTCPEKYSEKLEILKNKIQKELNVIIEISKILIDFPSKGSQAKLKKVPEEYDKDIFRESLDNQNTNTPSSNFDAHHVNSKPALVAKVNNITPPPFQNLNNEVKKISHSPLINQQLIRKASTPIIVKKPDPPANEDNFKIEKIRRERDNAPSSNNQNRKGYLFLVQLLSFHTHIICLF